MVRQGWIAVTCIVAGLLLLAGGTLIPAHLRAVDHDVLAPAGAGTSTLLDLADHALGEGRVGAASLFLQEARAIALPGVEERENRIRERIEREPSVARWGAPNEWLDRQLGPSLLPDASAHRPTVLEWLLPEAARQALWRYLAPSTDPAIMALIAARAIEETSLLPAPKSASGQPFDVALLTAGLLVRAGRAHPGLALDWERASGAAVRGKGTPTLESAMLNLLAAARRLNWEQLATLTERCEDAASLHMLVAVAGADGARWPMLISAESMASGARKLAAYVNLHGEGAVPDLRYALSLGVGATEELLDRGGPVHHAKLRRRVVSLLHLDGFSRWIAGMTQRAPWFAWVVKYLLWTDGIFLVIAGIWYGRRAFLDATNLAFEPRPDARVLGIITAAAVILLFLSQERLLNLKSGSSPSRPNQPLPVFQARLRFDIPQANTPAMNQKVLAMLVAFFVIQLAIYLVGLSRIRYIRGRLVDGPVKLKLLDNEEPMFDAPLYVGIGGSVLALVMRLSGFDEVSLMASYSSTLFGILFCFILKVVHVRPYRQSLILESAEDSVS